MQHHNDDLDCELAGLNARSRAELRERWSALTSKPAPKVSAGLMRLALAWQLQAQAYGGLSPRSLQRLDKAGKEAALLAPVRTPRQRLVREWQGKLHIVTIDGEGTITWEGTSWRSLSEVARAITGTRWSGPAFFGLKDRKKSA